MSAWRSKPRSPVEPAVSSLPAVDDLDTLGALAGGEGATGSAGLADDDTWLGDATAATFAADKPSGTGSTPERIGRFRVLDRLGAGGMGVVYSAYDGDLDRKIAIKLLRPRAEDDVDTVGRARLLREAQAMARLNHPHVIQVYEVGTHADDVFVAMEFVRGKSLGIWLTADPPPSYPAILEVFLQAGRGLAAAHTGGLVHRDFKPDNVMVGEDGRVRVLDFGLARASEASAQNATLVDAGAGEPASLETMTRTGSLTGTPAYMAPEQWRGESVDARTDQYSYCVALWEACYGARPFSGTGIAQLCAAVLAGRIPAPPADVAAPARIESILRRGLSTDRAQRWPDMNRLLAALSDDPIRRRRRWWFGALGGLAVAGAGVGLGFAGATRTEPEPPCTGGPARIAEVWDDSKRETLRAALTRSGRSYAHTTWATADGMLTDWTARWADGHRDACLARHRGEQSDTMLDLRMSCLDHRRQDFGALVDALGVGDDAALSRAVQAVGGLRPASDCADLEALTQAVPPPSDPQLRRRVEQVRAEVARARAARESGHYGEAVELARAALARAEPLNHPPLRAQAEYALADALDWAGQSVDALPRFKRAAFEALAVRDDALFADAANQVVWAYGDVMGQPELAQEWGEQAAAMLERMGGDRRLEAALHNALGATLMRAGEYDDATREHLQALELSRAEWGEDSAMTVRSLVNLGNIERERGRLDVTLERYREALALATTAWGAEHPQTMKIRVDVLTALSSTGDWRTMLAEGPPLVAAQERTLGPDHPDVITSLNELSTAYRRGGRHEQAAKLLRDAHDRLAASPTEAHGASRITVIANLARVEATLGHDAAARRLSEEALDAAHDAYGSENGELGVVYIMAGEVAVELGDPDLAIARFERGRELAAKYLAPQHRLVGVAEDGIGSVLAERGQHRAALEHYARARPIFEADQAGSRRNLEFCLNLEAASQLALGHGDAARRDIERAQSIDADDPEQALDTELLLAELLWSEGRTDAAREAATRARAAVTASRAPELVTTVDRWLAAHR